MTWNQVKNKWSNNTGQGIILRHLSQLWPTRNPNEWMPTYNSLTRSSRSVSLITHHHPLIFQWCVTPILPEDLFDIFPRQFYPIKPYFHQTKDVILTSNTVRLYMQIISLNIAWSKRYSSWNLPWVLPRRCRNNTSFLSGPSSSMRMNIFSSHMAFKIEFCTWFNFIRATKQHYKTRWFSFGTWRMSLQVSAKVTRKYNLIIPYYVLPRRIYTQYGWNN